MHRAFCINPTDNVATLLDDAPGPDNVQILGASHIQSISSLEPITLGHKIAITDIPKTARSSNSAFPSATHPNRFSPGNGCIFTTAPATSISAARR